MAISLVRKIEQRARWAMLRGAFAIGMGERWLRDRPGVRILVYHGVVPRPLQRIHARFVTTGQLDDQMGLLRKRFQVVSLDAVYSGDYDARRLAVAVTFDDGYRNNLEHALPVLQRYGIPATVFVTAPRAVGMDVLWADALDIGSAVLDRPIVVGGIGFRKDRKGLYVDAAGRQLKSHCKAGNAAFVKEMMAVMEGAGWREAALWADYWQLLDGEELKELAGAPGITIGCHGTQHLSLDRLSMEAALEEVLMGRGWIESAIGRPVRSFAFPDGAYVPTHLDTLSALGLEQLLLLEYRHGDEGDPRLRDRFTVHPFLTAEVLMAEMVKGHYL